MLDFGILKSSSLLMDCSCIAPLTPVVIVIRGFVFHPLLCIALINGSELNYRIESPESNVFGRPVHTEG